MFVLFAFAGALYRRRLLAANLLLIAAGVFVISFSARTLDARVCPALPLGTHFAWHLLNALLLYLLLRAALANRQQAHHRMPSTGSRGERDR